MRYKLSTLLILTACIAVGLWLGGRRATSEEQAYWGSIKAVPRQGKLPSPSNIQLWSCTPNKKLERMLVVMAEADQELPSNAVVSLPKPETQPNAVVMASRTAANSATMSSPAKGLPVVSMVVAVAMALDQANFYSEPRCRLGGEYPAYIDVNGIGTFEVFFVNDWGHYITTKIRGPSNEVMAYEQFARDDYHIVKNKLKVTSSGSSK